MNTENNAFSQSNFGIGLWYRTIHWFFHSMYHALLSTFSSWWIKQDQSIVWSSDATKYQKRNNDKFLWYIFISFIKCMTSIYLFVKYFLRFPHVYYTEDSNRSGLILLSYCVSLRFCNTLGAILLISSPELT